MTKTFSVLQRAAALLAALCLLAGLALPVCAESADDALFVQDVETIQQADDPAAETTTDEQSADADEAGNTDNTDDANSPDADTADSADGGENADGAGSEDNTATPAPAEDADIPADATPTPAATEPPAPTETPAPTAAPTPTPEPTPTATPMVEEDEEESGEEDTATLPADSEVAEYNSPESGTTYTFYFAPPASWGDSDTVTFTGKRGKSGDYSSEKSLTMTRVAGYSTEDKRQIYSVDITYNSGQDADCSWGGYVWIQFKSGSYSVKMKGPISQGTDTWLYVDDMGGHIFDAGLINSTDETWNANCLKPYTDVARKHILYGGQTIAFENKTENPLTNIKVTFYEKDGGEYKEVGEPQTIESIAAGKVSNAITIPNGPCSYVSFTDASGNHIGKKYYNFYNDEDASDEVGTFQYNFQTNYCFIYKGASSIQWGTPNTTRVFFDATFSDMSYKGDSGTEDGMPRNNGKLYYILTGANKETLTGSMTRLEDSSESRHLWYVDAPEGYTSVQFSNTSTPLTSNINGQATDMMTWEGGLKEPCFYADTGDEVTYGGDYREGYWDEKSATRDVENGKKAKIVKLDTGSFTPQSGVKYIDSTLYDYYSDAELNGKTRKEYSCTEVYTNRAFVEFEQFDRALSNYYKDYAEKTGKSVLYPLYTGHFQPEEIDKPYFSSIAGNLDLYGWGYKNSATDGLYKTFMAVNNSNVDTSGTKIDSSTTFQGLVNNTRDENHNPTLYDTDLPEPHFNEAFLTGENSAKAVLGKVYDNVAFPFKKDTVFSGTNGDAKESKAQYWYYNSNETPLYLKEDTNGGGYYLDSSMTAEEKERSKNLNTRSVQTGSYGFFPFNQNEGNHVNRYNYGYGAKLQFDFTLTDTGQVVVGRDDNGEKQTVPIKFFFSGDDDVWVFIDDKLVLDVGGAHAKAEGLLEFGADDENNTVTSYVSNIKASNNQNYNSLGNNPKNVTFNGTSYSFYWQSKTSMTLPKNTKHTLTMYYMERGMWESNMAVAFNFPDHNELQVEKQVDATEVRDVLQPYFTDSALKQFTVGIKNWATHYDTLDLDATTAKKPINLNTVGFTAARLAEGGNTKTNYLRIGESPGNDTADEKSQTLHWYASMDDRGDAKKGINCSGYRGKRYGSINLKETIDVSGMDYLSFQVYALVEKAYGSSQNAGALSVSYMYLQLVDTAGKTMGCLGSLDDNTATNTSYLYGRTSGNTAMQNGQWCTLKLDMSKLDAEDGFDPTSVKAIRVGYDYQRNIYFRNFTFVDVPQVVTNTGFTTKQYNITDYGSVKAGGLMNAVGARFTSNVDDKTYTVDTDGRFDLQNGETVTFVDQFRRGSYISLKEYTNEDLFDTTWEIYENGSLVTQNVDDDAVDLVDDAPRKMRGNNTTPDDGRKEVYKTGPDEDGKTIENDGYKKTEKPTENSIVFRSYIDPDGTDQFTKLKVKFINKVRTGSLSITKQVPADEYNDLKDETYTFTVRYTNIGGLGLEGDKEVTETVKVKVDETVILDKIPIGTVVTVTEDSTPNRYIKSITVNDQSADGEAHGSIDADKTDDNGKTISSVRVVFTNTARKLIDIDVEKKWQDAAGEELTANLPTSIWVKLQRRHAGSTNDADWTDVQGTVVELTKNNYDGMWKYTFTGMDAYDISAKDTYYEYRVTESDTKDGDYIASGTLKLGDYKYTVDGKTKTIVETDDSASLTLTNTQVPSVYELAITKQGLDENGTVTGLLDGVKFKLEKLGDDGNVDTSFNGNTGFMTRTTESGMCSFKDLPAGKYRLTELKTVDGYNLLAAPIEFVLKDGECLINDTAQKDMVKGDAANGFTVSLTINNRKGFTLPHTGADAPSLWLLIGLPLLVAGLLVLVFRYNRKGGKRS